MNRPRESSRAPLPSAIGRMGLVTFLVVAGGAACSRNFDIFNPQGDGASATLDDAGGVLDTDAAPELDADGSGDPLSGNDATVATRDGGGDDAGVDASGDNAPVDGGEAGLPPVDCGSTRCAQDDGTCQSDCAMALPACLRRCFGDRCRNNCQTIASKCGQTCTSKCQTCAQQAGCDGKVICQ